MSPAVHLKEWAYVRHRACTDITFSRLYGYRVCPIIETADTDYAADYEPTFLAKITLKIPQN